MKTKTYTVYKFNELPEEAKQKAIEKWRSSDGYPFSYDNARSLEAFEKISPVKVSKWEYGYQNFINFEMTCDDETAQLTGKKLAAYLKEHYGDILKQCCPFTGYCMDEPLLDPIRNFIKKPVKNVTLEDVMRDCLEAWLDSCRQDYEYSLSDEAIIDTIEANDYDFTIEGDID